MATLRPNKCYREVKNKPNTRVSQRKPRRSYVKGVPASRIRQFETGDPNLELPVKIRLSTKIAVQVRHNSLEAARIAANKLLDKNVPGRYFMKLLVYPHHILRENRIATGAGADRFQQGMRQSFGIPISTAARLKEGQSIFEIRVDSGKEGLVKEALNHAQKKLPCPCKITIMTA